MIIKQLQYKQRRNGSEVLLTDEHGVTTALDADVVVRFQLSTGMEVSEDLFAEICRENEFLLARRKLIRYLALRKKTTADALRYLTRAGYSPEAAEAAVDAARRLDYLDDSRYAEAFVNTRAKAGTKGPRMISKELQAKGVGAQDIAQAIAAVSDMETQLESARRVAAKKYPSLKDEDLVKASRRMSQHLARRGFDPDICERVTRELFGEPTQF